MGKLCLVAGVFVYCDVKGPPSAQFLMQPQYAPSVQVEMPRVWNEEARSYGQAVCDEYRKSGNTAMIRHWCR